jgi:hypothetical protein
MKALYFIGVAFAVALSIACTIVPASLQPPPGTETWLFFDGVCNLCDGIVSTCPI